MPTGDGHATTPSFLLHHPPGASKPSLYQLCLIKDKGKNEKGKGKEGNFVRLYLLLITSNIIILYFP